MRQKMSPEAIRGVADRAQLKSIESKRKRGEKLLPEDEEFLAAHTNNKSSRSPESRNPSREKLADEEVKSDYEYFSGYKPKPLSEQMNTLREFFPELRPADGELTERPLPEGAEGWFAIPKWQTLAPTYGEAVEKVLAKLSETRKGKFKNWREGELGQDYLKQSGRSEKMLGMLGDQQNDHDILVVAAQFGLRHRGRSVRRAREVMQVNEYGLGAFAVGIMLLTHPERLMNYDDLNVDCAGDEYAHAPGADAGFSSAPVFHFDGSRVEFDASWFNNAHVHYGSASAFLPAQAGLPQPALSEVEG